MLQRNLRRALGIYDLFPHRWINSGALLPLHRVFRPNTFEILDRSQTGARNLLFAVTWSILRLAFKRQPKSFSCFLISRCCAASLGRIVAQPRRRQFYPLRPFQNNNSNTHTHTKNRISCISAAYASLERALLLSALSHPDAGLFSPSVVSVFTIYQFVFLKAFI